MYLTATSTRLIRALAAVAVLLVACGSPARNAPADAGAYAARMAPLPGVPQGTAVATFAGGCFWCVEAAFDAVPGVLSTTSGYTGGRMPMPDYDAVSAGYTGHVEAVQVVFDPVRVSFERLLEVFWHNVDPLDARGQFCDTGEQYRSVIFFHSAEQLAAVEASRAALERTKPFRGELVTEVLPASQFWPAEVEHQNFHQTNPYRYRYYRTLCGRDLRLRMLWGEAAGK